MVHTSIESGCSRQIFLNIGKKYPKTSYLSKIFNKTPLNSFSCMPNISTLISSGNSKSFREIKILNSQMVTALRKKTAPSREVVK